jgi:hypothetical protein
MIGGIGTMQRLVVEVERHPACLLYFETMSKKFKKDTYFKGEFFYEKTSGGYKATLHLQKYIPKEFVFAGFSLFFAACVLWLLGLNKFLGWAAAVPGLIMLVVYWLLQSTPFYYLLLYLALRKRGYRGVIKARFV